MTKKLNRNQPVVNNLSKCKGDYLMSSVDLLEIKSSLNKEQLEMFRMSEEDIAKGRIISQEEIDRLDFEWLKGELKK